MLEYQQLLTMVLGNLGSILLGQGKSAEAITNFEEVVSVLESLKKSIGESPEFEDALAQPSHNLGSSYTSVSKFEEAANKMQSAIEIRTRILQTQANNADLHNGLAGSYVNLAEVRLRQGKQAEAKSLLEQGRPHHDRALPSMTKTWSIKPFSRITLICSVWYLRNSAIRMR